MNSKIPQSQNIVSVVLHSFSGQSIEIFDVQRFSRRDLDFERNLLFFKKSLKDSQATWKVLVGFRDVDVHHRIRTLLDEYHIDLIISQGGKNDTLVKYFMSLLSYFPRRKGT